MSQSNLAVLVSGTGTILEAMLAKPLPISLVMADRDCRGLRIAAEAGLATDLLPRADYGRGRRFDRAAYTAELARRLLAAGIDLVAMSGFMTVLAEPVFVHYAGRIFNTHPSLLPDFRGGQAVRDTLAAGAAVSGCTVHVATLHLDDGPILAQAQVPVLPDDTEETLHERIKEVERRLYPEVLRRVLAGELVLSPGPSS